MPYSTITTLGDGGPLGAGHCNTLENNAEFLYAIAHQAGWPCPSVHRNLTGALDRNNHIFTLRHRQRYLKFQIVSFAILLDFIRVFYNGHKVWGNEAPPAGTTTGVADLHTISTWPTHRGAWVTATSYDDLNAGDGDIVSQSGSYYKCKADHTSGATTQPGIGASWTTYWTLITIPALAGWYSGYVHADYGGSSQELALNYFYEDFTA